MNIFANRPVFLCTTLYLVGAVFGFVSALRGWFVAMVCLSILSVLAGIFIAGLWFLFSRKRLWPMVCLLSGILLSGGLVISYWSFSSPRITSLSARAGEEVEIQATVTDRIGSGGYMTTLAVDISTVGNEKIPVSALLICQYVSDLAPGETVSMKVTLASLNEAAGVAYDPAMLLADGYSIALLSEEETDISVTGMSKNHFSVRIGSLRRSLSAQLELLCGREAAGLPSALLLGEKGMIPDAVSRDFARVGVSHLLAISGLHMTLLFGMLAGLFLILGVPKRVRSVLLSALALLYLFLIGFPPSATRAIVMLWMVYLSMLLRRESDPLTALGIAAFLILFFDPRAVVDAGFWMSYLATLGLVTMASPIGNLIEERFMQSRVATCLSVYPMLLGLCKSLLKFLLSLLVGVTAMSFSLFVVSFVIGEVGILSPLSTIILTPFCACLLILTPLALLTAKTSLSPWISGMIRFVCDQMTSITDALSEPTWSVISVRNPIMIILAIVIAISLCICLMVNLPRRYRLCVLLPILIGWVCIGVTSAYRIYTDEDTLLLTYLQPSNEADSLVLVSGSEGFICDLSNGSMTALSAAVREAETNGATEIAALMLTHYHTRTEGALYHILAREKIRALWVPYPMTPKDHEHLQAYLEKTTEAGIPLVLYDDAHPLTIFTDATIQLERAFIERSVQPILLVTLDTAITDPDHGLTLYCGSAIFESDLAARATTLLKKADTVIFGEHGPVTKAPYAAGAVYRPDALIILSAKHDTALWLSPASIPDTASLWQGQKRMILPISRSSAQKAKERSP